MLSTRTKARLGAKGTVAMAKHPTLRRVAVKAGVPTAKVLAKREARSRLDPVGAAVKKAGSIVVVYGPFAADALGLTEAPKPRRRNPVLAVASLAALATAAVLLARRQA